ncbi:MAG TPA: BLUF domain-containing protein [Chthoniobacterales bacterium]
MFFLVYVSSAVNLFSKGELLKLLDISRCNNAKLGVTGMLLYKNGNFMQLIEGPEQAVRTLHAKIAIDSRHRGLITLLQGHQENREFEHWSMGFQSLDSEEVGPHPGYSDILDVTLTKEDFPAHSSKCLKLFWALRENLH